MSLAVVVGGVPLRITGSIGCQHLTRYTINSFSGIEVGSISDGVKFGIRKRERREMENEKNWVIEIYQRYCSKRQAEKLDRKCDLPDSEAMVVELTLSAGTAQEAVDKGWAYIDQMKIANGVVRRVQLMDVARVDTTIRYKRTISNAIPSRVFGQFVDGDEA